MICEGCQVVRGVSVLLIKEVYVKEVYVRLRLSTPDQKIVLITRCLHCSDIRVSAVLIRKRSELS